MRTLNQRFLVVALGVLIAGAALTAQAALIFDGLRQQYTIEIIRQGHVVSSLSPPPGATLQINAAFLSTDKTKTVSTFHGNVRATVKLADEVVFSILADEMRVKISSLTRND